MSNVPRNAMELLMMVLKTCCVHFERFILCCDFTQLPYSNVTSIRNIDKLPATVPRETIACLKGFVGLRSHDEIREWHEFCRNSPDKSVQGEPFAMKICDEFKRSLTYCT